MPIKKAYKKRTYPKRRAAVSKPSFRRKRASKSATNTPDIASCSVTRTLAGGLMNTMFSYNSFMLTDFPRAVAISRSYQQYRISGITLRLKPDFNVFNLGLGAPAPAQQPYLYYMLDKSGSIPSTITLEGLKQMGARPLKFSTNTRTITWKPTALVEMYTALAASPAAFKTTPWLSTNANPLNTTWAPSVVPHQGLKWFIEEGNGVAYAVDIDVELQFQFRKPLVIANANTPATGLSYAEINDSPDGIVGGPDQI